MQNKPNVKTLREELVESHLHYVDPLKSDYKKLIRSVQMYKRGHTQEELEVHGYNSINVLSFSECSFKPVNFRLLNIEAEIPRKKKR